MKLQDILMWPIRAIVVLSFISIIVFSTLYFFKNYGNLWGWIIFFFSFIPAGVVAVIELLIFSSLEIMITRKYDGF